ncbi:MAG: polymerase III DnaE protein, partial [Parcubacteria group bacterium GW2011_GWB1_55_9]
DQLGERGSLLENIETLLSYHREATAEAPQDSLFSAGGGSAFGGGGFLAPATLTLPIGKPVSLTEKLNWEKELLGIYVSGHPLDAHTAIIKKSVLTIAKIKEERQQGMLVILPVLVTLVRSVLTKSGEKMAFLTVEDTTDSIEAVVFPKLFKTHTSTIVPGACLLAKAKVSIRNGSGRGGEVSLAIEELKPL